MQDFPDDNLSTEMDPASAEALRSLEEVIQPNPENFRFVARIYADQISLIRRTFNEVNSALSQAQGTATVLFDFSNDPLNQLTLDDNLIELQSRIIDLLVLSAFGQIIPVDEFQDYAKSLVPLYAAYDFVGALKNSALRNPALSELEQEWLEGTNFSRVQEFFRACTASVVAAAEYCTISIDPLPEF